MERAAKHQVALTVSRLPEAASAIGAAPSQQSIAHAVINMRRFGSGVHGRAGRILGRRTVNSRIAEFQTGP
jgi:hypothetical protein